LESHQELVKLQDLGSHLGSGLAVVKYQEGLKVEEMILVE